MLAKAFATSFVVERSAFDASYAELLGSRDAFIAVAEDGDHLAGYLLGFDHRAFYANGRVSWVEEIMVHEMSRRKGIGRQLMDCLSRGA